MEPGYYENCTITEASIAIAGDTPIMAFTCKLPNGGEVEVEQRMGGDKPIIREIAQDVAKLLGMEFTQSGLSRIGETVGKTVTLRLKLNYDSKGNQYENWNIVTGRRSKRVEGDEASRVLKDFFMDDGDVPF